MDDEFEKIAWLKRRFELGHAQVLAGGVGIGDDAAVLDLADRPTAVTVDTQVEGVHFRREFASCAELGARASIAAASDIWAMGGQPMASVVALNLPRWVKQKDFEDLVDGIADAAAETGARVVGGNLSRADALAITTTVLGVLVGEPVMRRGAQPGDPIHVTGVLGAAALGLAILEARRGDLESAGDFIARWRRPPRHGGAAERVAEVASAAIDISDGLLQDLGHVCDASGVGARIEADKLPLADGHTELCEKLGVDPLELALQGGEDYELLFTVPASADQLPPSTRIGTIIEGMTVDVVDAEGRPLEVADRGFRHFS